MFWIHKSVLCTLHYNCYTILFNFINLIWEFKKKCRGENKWILWSPSMHLNHRHIAIHLSCPFSRTESHTMLLFADSTKLKCPSISLLQRNFPLYASYSLMSILPVSIIHHQLQSDSFVGTVLVPFGYIQEHPRVQWQRKAGHRQYRS